MIIYSYDEETKEYLGAMEANEDPLETLKAGHPVYAFPPNFTDIEPPKFEAFQIPIFKGDKWEIVEDHRGTTGFNKKTGEAIVMIGLGALPAEFTFEKPMILEQLRADKVKEVKEEADRAKKEEVTYKNVTWTAERWVDLARKLEGVGIFALVPITIGEETVTLNKNELEEIVKFFYLRSMFIERKKEELIKEVLHIRGKKKLQEFTPVFDVKGQVLESVEKTIEEINEMFNGES